MNEVSRDPTIDGFCQRQRISRAGYYNLRDSGKGPREYYVGRLVRISPEAESEWILERERESAGRTSEAA